MTLGANPALGERWLRRPQRVWLRRALFQIHLWTGIGVGLYILAVCVSGSAVVFRVELFKMFSRGPRTVAVAAQRLTDDELGAIAKRDYPNYSVSHVWAAKKPTDAVEIWLDREGVKSTKEREFDPYTGKDLGNRQELGLGLVSWLVDFHGNLGFGPTGRIVNGAGGLFLAVLCLTGLIIWWPGIANWRRSLLLAWRGDWKRFNWELHSVVGFWLLAIVLMFGLTGAYLTFTMPFERAINAIAPLKEYRLDITDDVSDDGPTASAPKPQVKVIVIYANPGPGKNQPKLTFGDELVRWSPRLHYGRFAGWKTKALWVAMGMIPPFLFVTGAIMWWNRVLRPAAWRARKKARLAAAAHTPELQGVGSSLRSPASE